ncbi:C6 finger domain protein [Penicillium macrosclerotiorum]|uniref:C6 finger domain protein n=1 Tax=Penicillium macrosclerotiorum TaxID=303699 RepID=UPI00254803FB|nr:C6 finger domain protein [Penicillium macrosclerotiorum]KAJ5679759.1 C6 finger domain protein [Penicillium macrosclerotiorum]
MPLRELQFIIAAPESATLTTPQRRIARSHAARSAHARERHFRTSQYQAQKKRELLNDVTFRLNKPPDIVTVLPASRKDPFTSFARPLKPLEEMLLDHCMFLA